MESPDVWTPDARWKFVLGHELGHMVQDFANAGLDADYRFTGYTPPDEAWNGVLRSGPTPRTEVAHNTRTPRQAVLLD
jgi:hypothetical protein